MSSRPIHPFPARMAPEIALAQCQSLPSGATVLDPMIGSGTVLRAAVDAGLGGVGYDIDPLAVLMARAWTTPVDRRLLDETASELVERAMKDRPPRGPDWIDDDPETERFVNYWFAAPQQRDLRRLSPLLAEQSGPVGDALRVALSRLIVTKDRGASLARDVSHSRPHRVLADNAFEVFPGFLRAVQHVGMRLGDLSPASRAQVSLGDARNLSGLSSSSIDAVITSPPYLNALDYMRGHRLALVWLGYSVGDLRAIRAERIGAERMLDRAVDRASIHALAAALGEIDGLPPRILGMVDRFLLDLLHVLQEVHRVLKSGGKAILVVGNSCLRGVFIDNAAAVEAAAKAVGLHSLDRQEREIPPSRRYLPPPSTSRHSTMTNRMRTEVVLSFCR